MRYFYITCLILSSFFIYNQSSAENISRQYAFFVPNNVYNENTTINNIDSMRPRHAPSAQKNIKSKPKQQRAKKNLPFTRPPLVGKIPDTETTTNTVSTLEKNTLSQNVTSSQSADSATDTINTKPTSPTIQTSNQVIDTHTPTQNTPPASKYNLDEDFITEIKKAETKTINVKPEKTEKTISERLAEIPFPDPEQPKYKQIFGNYGITLRTLYRQNEMPADYEQDEVLSKANSIKRFLVK
jgi:hypothetical protein